ncbi:MAG: hypothetical protein M3Y42_03055 [Actinomycetota bacterium]|nr:hypothetical protein [Actinomycetota bacterium]MDQ2955926.1 hypothetical protein [Actinomycetota bacterium]
MQASSGAWTLQNDDDTKIEHLTSGSLCSNGTGDNDCWRLTTPNGTQYYFGRNKLPGWTSGAPTTQSTWTVPVYGNNTGEPCHAATFAASSCLQAWRWNLDYVLDPHGNSEAFYYTPETNKYAQNGSTTTATSYVRGGTLTRIDYGMRAGYELSQKAPEQVLFTLGDRCDTTIANEPANGCTTTPPTAAYWPDVPWYQSCTATTCSGQSAPTFWSSKRLSSVQTQYWNGTSYLSVDKWSLTQAWPLPGDASSPAMTLTSISHTGLVRGSASVPATTFGYQLKANRVAPPNGIVPLMKSRLSTINTEAGAQLTINYLDSDCSGTSPATPNTNTKRCFPQYWAPPGSAVSLDWFRKYLVASVVQNPEMNGPQSLDVTTYDYSVGTPAWRYDTSPLTPDGQRSWSVFAGYSRVRVEHGDLNSAATVHTTDISYFQGMNGDLKDTTGALRSNVQLTATDGTAVTDSLWWAGRVFETVTYNGLGGPVVADTVTTPWASAPTLTGTSTVEHITNTAATFTYTPTARYVGDLSTMTHAPLSSGGTRTTQTNTSYGSYGRPSTIEDLGDISQPGQARCTVTNYADNTTLWLLQFPAEVRTFAGTCASTPGYPAAAISDTKTSYDGLALGAAPTAGDVSQTQVANGYSSSGPSSWLTSTSRTYDELGRILTSTDALNHTTTTSYTPTAITTAGQPVTGNIGPVTQLATTDPAGISNTETFDPAWGALSASTDANSHTTTSTYDPFGRRGGVWLPDRQPAANYPQPSTSYAYNLTAGQPVSVATTSLTPSGSTMTAYTLYDGLLRPRQTQTPAQGADPHATPGSSGTDVSDTIYDAAGQAVTATGSYLISNAPSGLLFVPPQGLASVPGLQQRVYDGAGRTTAVITEVLGQEQWRTSYAYPGSDRTDTTPPAGGTATTSYQDGRGETTELLQYHGAGIGDPTDPASYDLTSYTFDTASQMQTMTRPSGQQWSWSYDTLGHVVSATDPDTGTTTSSYDAGGQLQTTRDANGITLAYSYDNDGRKTNLNQDSTAGPLLQHWSYDSLAKGLPTSQTSYTGSTPGTPGTPYIQTVTGYDADNHPLGQSTILPAGSLGAGSAAYTYTVGFSYNPDGSLAAQSDPTAGGLPAETLTSTYTSLGNLYSYGGKSPYLTSISYDGIGHVNQLSHYNGSQALYDTYTYTEGTNRLARATTTTAAQSNAVAADLTYSYDNAGDVTTINNAPSIGPADTQCFTYDYLQRLTQAWTPSDSNCTSTPATSNLGGPAPYWQSYDYNQAGDRIGITNYATTSTGSDNQDTYSYPSSTQPDTIQSVTHTSAPAGTGSYTPTGTGAYQYNPGGQLTSAPGSTMTWTPQGQLASVTLTATSQTQQRTYGPDGNLLLQSDPVTGITAYLGDTELKVPANSTTVSGQRTYTALGQSVAVRTATTGITGSTLTWTDTDPHGTAELTENPTTGAISSRQYDPFGNQRSSVSAWPDDRGFLHAPTDTLTGLVDLGARDYNPQLGAFISADPVLDPADPQQNNGYAYAHDNPSTLSDPTGLRAADDNGNTDSSWAKDQHNNGSACTWGVCGNTANPRSGNTGGGGGGGGGYNSGDTITGPGYTTPGYVIDTADKLATHNPAFDPKGYIANHTLELALPDYVINKIQKLSTHPANADGAINTYQQSQALAPLPTTNPPAPQHHGSGGCHGFLGCIGHGLAVAGKTAWAHKAGIAMALAFGACIVLSAGLCIAAGVAAAAVSNVSSNLQHFNTRGFLIDSAFAVAGGTLGAGAATDFKGLDFTSSALTRAGQHASDLPPGAIDWTPTAYNMGVNNLIGSTGIAATAIENYYVH